MRHILLDEGVPVGFAERLKSSGCKASHVVEIGFGGTPDRQLLAFATSLEVDVLITCDQHMVHQQNLRDISFGIIVLCTNNWSTIGTVPPKSSRQPRGLAWSPRTHSAACAPVARRLLPQFDFTVGTST